MAYREIRARSGGLVARLDADRWLIEVWDRRGRRPCLIDLAVELRPRPAANSLPDTRAAAVEVDGGAGFGPPPET